MQKIVKAFGILDEYVDTVLGGTAIAGELSNYSRTFSTDKDTLSDDNKDAGHAVVFSAKDEDGEWIENFAEYRDQLLDAVEAVAAFNNATAVATQFNAVFQGPTYSNVMVGDGVLAGNRLIPEWVQFDFAVGQDTYTVKVWFVDAAFQTQYDEWEVRVVPPLPDPDDMYVSYAVMNANLSQVTSNERIEQAHIVAAGAPYTKLKPVTLTWYDRNNPSLFIEVTFLVLAYGNQALLQSNMYAGIREYLDTQTGHTLEEWVEHFPELVAVNRYTILPLWDRPSISPDGMPVPFYNSLVAPQDALDMGKAVFPTKADADVLPYIESGAMFYKGIGLIFIGDPTNRQGEETFYSAHQDYSIFDTIDAGLNLISLQTKNIIIAIEQLIRLAETDDGVSALPAYAERENAGSAEVIVKTVGSTLVQVVTKNSFDDLFTP